MKPSKPFFAVLTPFNRSGDIDYEVFKDYLGFLRNHGVENIVTNGTTGEFLSLTLRERKEILKFCRKNFDGKIVNNISSSCLRDCFDLMEHSGDYADAVLVLLPFYYANVTDEGILAFFRELLKETSMPFYLYNFPRHTQNSVKPEIVSTLLNEFDNLLGLKDSSGNIDTAKSFKKGSPKFQVFMGSDSLAWDALQAGLDGSVSGAGNPVPEFLVQIYDCFINGKLELAKEVQDAFNVWNTFRKKVGVNEIAIAKVAISARIESFPTHVRLPLIEADNDLKDKILKVMREEILPLLG